MDVINVQNVQIPHMYFSFFDKNIQMICLLLLKCIKGVGLLVPVEIPRHATRPGIKVLSYYKDPRLYYILQCCYYRLQS